MRKWSGLIIPFTVTNCAICDLGHYITLNWLWLTKVFRAGRNTADQTLARLLYGKQAFLMINRNCGYNGHCDFRSKLSYILVAL